MHPGSADRTDWVCGLLPVLTACGGGRRVAAVWLPFEVPTRSIGERAKRAPSRWIRVLSA